MGDIIYPTLSDKTLGATTFSSTVLVQDELQVERDDSSNDAIMLDLVNQNASASLTGVKTRYKVTEAGGQERTGGLCGLEMENNWDTTASSRDAKWVLDLSLNGSVAEKMSVSSAGHANFSTGYVQVNNQGDPGTLTGGVRFGSQDSSGSTLATMSIRTEEPPEASAAFTQTHRLPIWVNGTEYYLSLDSV